MSIQGHHHQYGNVYFLVSTPVGKRLVPSRQAGLYNMSSNSRSSFVCCLLASTMQTPPWGCNLAQVEPSLTLQTQFNHLEPRSGSNTLMQLDFRAAMSRLTPNRHRSSRFPLPRCCSTSNTLDAQSQTLPSDANAHPAAAAHWSV